MPAKLFLRATLCLLAGFALGPSTASAEAPVGGVSAHGGTLLRQDRAIRREFERLYPGVLPESKVHRARPTDRAFDWCDVFGGGLNVHNQAAYTTCWTHAPIEALEWSWKIRNGYAPILSVQPILDRTQKTGGGRADLVLGELLRHGTARATDYPYTGQPGGFRPDVATDFRPIAWGRVGGKGEVPPVEALKRAIVAHGPVVASVWTDRPFHRYRTGVFEGSPGVKPGAANHSVLITGWDDDRGAWRVQNSWGVKWGEKGFMWLRYGANNIGMNAAWLEAQSRFYPLPDGAHASLGPGADPFHTWPTRYPLDVNRVVGVVGPGAPRR